MTDPVIQFQDAMRSVGLEPPKTIQSGQLHRFPGVGKSNGNHAAWCVLFEDGNGGCFGDWSAGFSQPWQAKREKPFTEAERSEFKQRVEEAKARAESERDARQADAARRAREIWNLAEPARDTHPYLELKGISPHGTREYKESLVIPLYDGEALCSLQFIGPDGAKRFLSGGRTQGCYFLLGVLQDAQVLCIAEGVATAATINRAAGYPVAVAFNAGNLKAVAQAMRERFPDLPLIVCADDDAFTDGNPGLSKATEGAREVGAFLAVPGFQGDRPHGATDFNDMAAALGLDAVAQAVREAVPPNENGWFVNEDGRSETMDWPEPAPLTTKTDSKPYPLDALPDTIRQAVEEVQGFIKAPIPLVASSALGALSVALQAYIDVQRADKLSGPVSLYFLTIADSGERKTTCDGFFTRAIREYQSKQIEFKKPELVRYQSDLAAWEAKRAGLLDKIRKDSKSGKEITGSKENLEKHELEQPVKPKLPGFLRGDDTPENLAWTLAREWPSAGVVSAEAGSVFGSHGMGKESIMRNLALLNTLWDGGTHSIGRRTSESFTVQGVRLSMALQIQEATLRYFFDRSQGLARGSGFLARFLIAWPESTQGTRFFTEPPESWPALEHFNERIATLLDQPVPMDEEGAISPPLVPLAPEAKEAWKHFHDAIERDLVNGGNLYDIRDVASKSAENAVRLAALFQLFEHGVCGAVGWKALQGASSIITWHLHESLRFFGELALPEELSDSTRLDSWLIEYCNKNRVGMVPRREVQRHVTPIRLRQKLVLDNALKDLVELDRIRVVEEGRRKEIHVNPALLSED